MVIDGREKLPYTFQGLHADAKDDRRPLDVGWEWNYLKTGDYSIQGFEDKVAVERKELSDLYMTLGQNRARFEAEHERMARLDFAAVVIEASLDQALNHPPERSRLNPKTVFRTFVRWLPKYGVPWIWAEDRRLAEVTTYRLLEGWWWQAQQKKAKEESNVRT